MLLFERSNSSKHSNVPICYSGIIEKYQYGKHPVYSQEGIPSLLILVAKCSFLMYQTISISIETMKISYSCKYKIPSHKIDRFLLLLGSFFVHCCKPFFHIDLLIIQLFQVWTRSNNLYRLSKQFQISTLSLALGFDIAGLSETTATSKFGLFLKNCNIGVKS